jgi:hypothetical protein
MTPTSIAISRRIADLSSPYCKPISLCTRAGGTVHVCGTTDGTIAWYRRDRELVNNASVTIGWSYVFYGVIDPSASEEPEDGYFTAPESFSDSVDSADSDDEN